MENQVGREGEDGGLKLHWLQKKVASLPEAVPVHLSGEGTEKQQFFSPPLLHLCPKLLSPECAVHLVQLPGHLVLYLTEIHQREMP